MSSGQISPNEVEGWLKNSRQKYSQELINHVATKFERMRLVFIDDPSLEKLEQYCDLTESEEPLAWDVQGIANAALALQKAMPAIMKHWTSHYGSELESTVPYKAVQAIKPLEDALTAALEYVVFPFGRYDMGRQNAPRSWHASAIVIAHILGMATLRAGVENPSYEKNSKIVGVIYLALGRIGHNTSMFGQSAVSQHVLRFFKKAGKPALPTI